MYRVPVVGRCEPGEGSPQQLPHSLHHRWLVRPAAGEWREKILIIKTIKIKRISKIYFKKLWSKLLQYSVPVTDSTTAIRSFVNIRATADEVIEMWR